MMNDSLPLVSSVNTTFAIENKKQNNNANNYE